MVENDLQTVGTPSVRGCYTSGVTTSIARVMCRGCFLSARNHVKWTSYKHPTHLAAATQP